MSRSALIRTANAVRNDKASLKVSFSRFDSFAGRGFLGFMPLAGESNWV